MALIGLRGLGVIITVFSTLFFGLWVNSLKRKDIEKRDYVEKIYQENAANLKAATQQIQRIIDSEDKAALKKIVNLDLEELNSLYRNKSISALTVLRAYQENAIEVHNRTNCIVSWVPEAEEQAKKLDRVPLRKRGPLHGVPISVKECYDVAHTFSTGGLTKFSRNKAEADCPAVALVKKLGGIPFCKTNVPQGMVSLQCSNPIYGTTTNPHMTDRESGGSSGGEGALIGGGGSILGLANDIGGSLRNPAAFSGAYTLKPTASRGLSQDGVVDVTGTHPSYITTVGGFIARTAPALETAWREVWHARNAGEGNRGPRWDQKVYNKSPKKIGFLKSFELLEPAFGCQRAVEEAAYKLEELGYELVEIPPPDLEEVLDYYHGIILSEIDSGLLQFNLDIDVEDSTLTSLMDFVRLYQLPIPSKLKRMIGEYMSASILSIPKVFNSVKKLNFGDYMREKFVENYLKQMDEWEVDIILCPAQLMPAPKTGVMGRFPAGIIPYIPWNVLDFPAGIAPITQWTDEDTRRMKSYPRGYKEHLVIREACENAVGLPLGVQVNH